MKIKNTISVLLVAAVLLTGCQKDDDPAEHSAQRETQPLTEDTVSSRQDVTVLTVSQTEPNISDTSEISESSSAADTQEALVSETSAPKTTEAITSAIEVSAETTAEEPTVTVSPAYDRAFFQNDLFIGDSIFTGLYLYDFLDKTNVFAEVGLNPESAAVRQIDGATCIERAEYMAPKHIYIMLGSNGLAFLEPSYMAAKMSELTAQLETACPSAQICVISISPVTKAHDAEGNETMAKVNAYNTALRSMCSEEGYTYIDLCSLMTDGEGYFSDEYAAPDGLHFEGSAYKLLLNTVQNAVR